MKAWDRFVWRRKKAAWRRARYPELWSPRARVRTYVMVAELLVWKHAWLEPLATLHRFGFLTREQFEHAAFARRRSRH